jgi:hypothetical protein
LLRSRGRWFAIRTIFLALAGFTSLGVGLAGIALGIVPLGYEVTVAALIAIAIVVRRLSRL